MQEHVKQEPMESIGGSGAAAPAAGGSSMDVETGGVIVKTEETNGGVVFTSTTEFTTRLEVQCGLCDGEAFGWRRWRDFRSGVPSPSVWGRKWNTCVFYRVS